MPKRVRVSSNLGDKRLYLTKVEEDTSMGFYTSNYNKSLGSTFGGGKSSYKKNDNLNKFSSVGQHLGLQSSCRDDLENLGYTLLNFLYGGMLWHSKNSGVHQKKPIRAPSLGT
jgi:hypothetical protein